jgi:hypothetical protein
MVVNSNREYDSAPGYPFPPVGATGEIISGLDNYNEYDVMFDEYPCPVQTETGWVTHKSMIVFIDEKFEQIEIEEELSA